jgi:hypothetical protein
LFLSDAESRICAWHLGLVGTRRVFAFVIHGSAQTIASWVERLAFVAKRRQEKEPKSRQFKEAQNAE